MYTFQIVTMRISAPTTINFTNLWEPMGEHIYSPSMSSLAKLQLKGDVGWEASIRVVTCH